MRVQGLAHSTTFPKPDRGVRALEGTENLEDVLCPGPRGGAACDERCSGRWCTAEEHEHNSQRPLRHVDGLTKLQVRRTPGLRRTHQKCR